MPFLLAPLILAYLMLLGIACAALVARRVPAAVVFVSPATGLGVLLALALSLSRVGLPVASFALALTLGLGGAAGVVVAWRFPQIAWRELRDIAPAVAAGLILAGAPIVAFGFNWVGNANADMGLYVNSAENFLRHGFFDVPDLDTLRSNVDAVRNAWFWEVLPPNRYGADVLIALAAAVFRVPAYEIYMIVQAAAFGALVLATGALVLDLGSRLRTYVTAAVIAVASPLMLYTIYQQLLPQLLGQVAIVAAAVLVQTATSGWATVQRGLATGCTMVALLLIYPEIAPFLVFGAVVIAPFALVRHRGELRGYLREAAVAAGAAAATIVVLLNVQLFTIAASFSVLFHIGSTAASTAIGAINYYLVPSGLANLWGFLPFNAPSEPWLTLGISAGFFALAAVLFGSFGSLRRGRFSDGMAVALLLFSLYLFSKRSSYGLFKLAFLLQPFLAPFIASVPIAAGAFLGRSLRVPERAGVVAVLVAVIASTIYSSFVYLGSTNDEFAQQNANYAELHAASSHRLYAQLDRIQSDYATIDPHVRFDTDVLLPNLATLEGAAFLGHPLRYVAFDPYANLYGSVMYRLGTIPGWPKETRTVGERRRREREVLFGQRQLSLGGAVVETYVPPDGLPRRGDVLIQTGPSLTILNRSASSGDFDVRAARLRDVHRWLTLVSSDLGFAPFTKPAADALGPVEPDPFDHRRTLATVGPSMLLEVLSGEPTVRLRLDLTGTLNPARADALPAITVAGMSSVQVTNLGNGGARIVTPPIRPLTVLGHRYLVIRFAARPLHFVAARSWLMSLFGSDVDLEPRKFVLYGRDISIAEDRPPTPPSVIASFPQDVLDRSLQFSGIYEDGWLSGKVRARLHAPAVGFFRLRVNVPPADAEHTVMVSIDGRPVKKFIARPSTYVDLELRSPGLGDHDFAIAASSLSPIAATDGRKTWGRLEELRFLQDIGGPGVDVADGEQWYPFEVYQNRTFRWTKRAARLRIGASRSRRILRVDIAPGPSVAGRVDVSVSVGGRVTRAHIDREREIAIDVAPSSGPLDVVFKRISGKLRVANDPRDLTLRVFSANISNAK